CLVKPRRIIDSGVDDFAVARADALADPTLALDNDHLAPGPRERPRDGKPDNARADDETFDRFHVLSLLQQDPLFVAHTRQAAILSRCTSASRVKRLEGSQSE